MTDAVVRGPRRGLVLGGGGVLGGTWAVGALAAMQERYGFAAADADIPVVVVHPPYRWQRAFRRWLIEDLPGLEERTGIAVAVENMFPVRVAGRDVEGLDLIRVNGDGLIDDLRVLVRPLSGLNALVARMGEEIPVVMRDLGLA